MNLTVLLKACGSMLKFLPILEFKLIAGTSHLLVEGQILLEHFSVRKFEYTAEDDGL